jgi:hypothetical protein
MREHNPNFKWSTGFLSVAGHHEFHLNRWPCTVEKIAGPTRAERFLRIARLIQYFQYPRNSSRQLSSPTLKCDAGHRCCISRRVKGARDYLTSIEYSTKFLTGEIVGKEVAASLASPSSPLEASRPRCKSGPRLEKASLKKLCVSGEQASASGAYLVARAFLGACHEDAEAGNSPDSVRTASGLATNCQRCTLPLPYPELMWERRCHRHSNDGRGC